MSGGPVGDGAEESRGSPVRGDAAGSPLRWTDSHCHLQYAPDEAAVSATLSRALSAGVTRLVCVGTDEPSSRRAIDLAAGEAGVPAEIYATIGLHPHDASEGVEGVAALVAQVSLATDRRRVVAVGECGLDYHYDRSPRSTQRRVFAAQVALANEHRLALVIHTREALDDTLAILDAEGVPERTVFHCFTGGAAEAERCLEVGAYLSFSGIVTFQNADDVRGAARLCPLDRILVETDSPYLTPVPHRGKSNEPHYVTLVGEAVAREKGLEPARVAAATWENASAVFRLATR